MFENANESKMKACRETEPLPTPTGTSKESIFCNKNKIHQISELPSFYKENLLNFLSQPAPSQHNASSN